MAVVHKVIESYLKTDDEITSLKSLVSVIESNERLPIDEDRNGEALLWLVAGHNTTGYSVATTMILLANNKRAQDWLRGELKKKRRRRAIPKSQYMSTIHTWNFHGKNVIVTFQ